MPTVFLRFKATFCLLFFRECNKYPNRPVGWQTERSGSWYGFLLRVFAQIIHPIRWKRGPWDVSGCLWEHSESHEERVSHSMKECDATACVKVTGRVGGAWDLHASFHLQLSQLCKWVSVWDRPTREEMKLLTVSSIFFQTGGCGKMSSETWGCHESVWWDVFLPPQQPLILTKGHNLHYLIDWVMWCIVKPPLPLCFSRRESCNEGEGDPPLYVNVNMASGEIMNTWIDSLQAFFPGLQVRLSTLSFRWKRGVVVFN